ncbi:MAG: cardiolipin synthase [Desulfobacterales bacterium]
MSPHWEASLSFNKRGRFITARNLYGSGNRKAHFLAVLLVCFSVAALSACARLPDLDYLSFPHSPHPYPRINDEHAVCFNPKIQAIIDDLGNDAGDRRILDRHIKLVEAISGKPLIRGNEVRLLRDGPETLAAMKKAIRDARDHIHLETFIIRDDSVGRPLADLLLKKCFEGVRVKMIYDGYGSRRTPEAFFERLRAGGIELFEFNPLSIWGLCGKWTFNNRDHRKILIVDGKIAFTGGINFYRVYEKSPSAVIKKKGKPVYYWRDTQVQVEGPAVAEFQKLFLDMWQRHGTMERSLSHYFPALEKKGDTLVRVIAGTPEQKIPNIYATYMSAIFHAEEYIYITQAYFIPDHKLIEALSAAVQRGVDVKIIVPGVSDFWMPVYAGRAKYTSLLKAGIKLYERQGALLHSKTAVIDGVWSTVGSSNLDSRSFLHDAEANAVILDSDFAEKMEDMFQEDLAQSEAVVLEEWKIRPLLNLFLERFALAFDYWL